MNEISTFALNFSNIEAKELLPLVETLLKNNTSGGDDYQGEELITRCLWENDPETYPERKQEYLALYGRVTFAEAEREYRYLSFMAKVYWKLLIAARCQE